MLKFFLSKKYWVLGIILIFSATAWFFTRPTSAIPEGIEMATVERGDVTEIISETGYILAAQAVDLAFERSGRVIDLPIEEGTAVSEGDVLVRLDASQQSADLSAAYARLEAEQIRLKELQTGADSMSLAVTQASVEAAETTLLNAQLQLAEVTAAQDQLVENARKTLLTYDLQAYLVDGEREDTSKSYTAPTITGMYADTKEGSYRLELYGSGAPSGSSFRVSGLENGTQSVSTVSPVAVGTQGLYVQFPENFAAGTVWEIPVPNSRSANYTANLNAYNAALNTRSTAITSAQNAVAAAEAALKQGQSQYTQVSGSARDERVAAQRALVRQMQAAVEAAQVALDSTVIRAPFNGIVAAISTVEGQIISPSTPVVTVFTGSDYELVVNISESDIKEVTVGDQASVILDAYNDMLFEATITRIAPSAVIADGVRIFEVRLQFTQENELIRAGLSADIDIKTASRSDVTTVPTRSIIENENGKFVRTLAGKTVGYLPVQIGLRGSEGKTEIIEGLEVGQSIINFADRSVLEKFESN